MRPNPENRLNSTIAVLSICLAASALSALPALAGGPLERASDRAERQGNRVEARQNLHESVDDYRDLARLESISQRYEIARKPKNEPRLLLIEQELNSVIRFELAEGRREVARDRAEVRRDNGEVRSSRREARRDRTADDRHDLRDDRRDRRDDVRDTKREVRAQAERLAIAQELQSLIGSMKKHDLQRKQSLIDDLVGLARQENRQNRAESREDGRERREDRRERREG